MRVHGARPPVIRCTSDLEYPGGGRTRHAGGIAVRGASREAFVTGRTWLRRTAARRGRFAARRVVRPRGTSRRARAGFSRRRAPRATRRASAHGTEETAGLPIASLAAVAHEGRAVRLGDMPAGVLVAAVGTSSWLAIAPPALGCCAKVGPSMPAWAAAVARRLPGEARELEGRVAPRAPRRCECRRLRLEARRRRSASIPRGALSDQRDLGGLA